MGTRGPAPKRSDKRLGHVAKAVRESKVRAPAAPVVVVPESDPGWHPVALAWFESLPLSGQSVFYDPSDWATAVAVAESMSREFHPQPVVDKDGSVQWVKFPPKAAALSAWRQMMAGLLVTEGDRRRVGLELERPKPEVADDVSELDVYRDRLRSG